MMIRKSWGAADHGGQFAGIPDEKDEGCRQSGERQRDEEVDRGGDETLAPVVHHTRNPCGPGMGRKLKQSGA
ncbi:MAG: hypothetical protein HC872_00050 [Gammaproteobacteria bacterium]|nr:hypothetical protein [Gammaproteobacteria bacterium]